MLLAFSCTLHAPSALTALQGGALPAAMRAFSLLFVLILAGKVLSSAVSGLARPPAPRVKRRVHWADAEEAEKLCTIWLIPDRFEVKAAYSLTDEERAIEDDPSIPCLPYLFIDMFHPLICGWLRFRSFRPPGECPGIPDEALGRFISAIDTPSDRASIDPSEGTPDEVGAHTPGQEARPERCCKSFPSVGLCTNTIVAFSTSKVSETLPWLYAFVASCTASICSCCSGRGEYAAV